MPETNNSQPTSNPEERVVETYHSPTYVTRLEYRVHKAKGLLQSYRDHCAQLRGQLTKVENERDELETYVSQQREQLLSLLQNCQELKQEKEQLDSRYTDLHLMNKALFQVFSESTENEDNPPRLGLEQLLVKQAEQRCEIEQLQSQVQYQEAQVRAAMCVLQNVHQPDGDSHDGTGSETTTVHDLDCSCDGSRDEADGH